MLAVCCVLAHRSAADEAFWSTRAYQVHAVLALDLPGGDSHELVTTLPTFLEKRALGVMGPAWDLKVDVAGGVLEQQVVELLTTQPADPPPDDFPSHGDKLILLWVRASADGYELAGREFDRFVQRWGMTIRRHCRQHQALSNQLFELVWTIAAPVAQFELDPDDPKLVTLQLRAGSYSLGGEAAWARPGDVFLPVLRRTTRSGKLLADGIQPVPWTYIEVLKVDGGKIAGRVQSGSARPFGMRRRGRVEQVAVAVRADPAATVLQFHSRTTADKPLLGYEVHARNLDEEATRPIGSSDRQGRISVPPGRTRLQLLFVKNGSELLARLPIVPGVEREIVVPLPDDDARLQAEARLSAMREELVDLVVRRNILMARATQKIEAKEWDEAQQLLRTLDQLPGRPQFDLALSNEKRLLQSDDPQVQRRIDRLIEATQTVLAQYLDSGPISQLHDRLREKQRAESGERSAESQKGNGNRAETSERET
jgi:hypothetical protein